jgi:hypothetical protein
VTSAAGIRRVGERAPDTGAAFEADARGGDCSLGNAVGGLTGELFDDAQVHDEDLSDQEEQKNEDRPQEAAPW